MLGAIIGDIVGSVYEFNNYKAKDFDPFFHPECFFTDDTVCTAAVAESLTRHIDPAVSLREWGRRYWENGGWGMRFAQWLGSDDEGPYDSFGNGAGMRVSPAGFLARTVEEAIYLSDRVTEVTHNHPQGMRGAAATAAAIYWARSGMDTHDIRTSIAEKFGYDLSQSVDEIRPWYRYNERALDTVPQALTCALEATSFEDAIRNAISIGGDSDTIAAIAGGLAEALFGIPENMAECYLWGRGTPKDTVKAREWLVKSAKSGYFRSQRRLAEIYFYGMDVERNYPEAGRWASLAADQGDAEAQTIVAEMFIFGYGVETDPAAGAKWLMEAANQDHPKAQGLLGVMHAEGVGVKRDWITALKWLKKAAEQEDERALEFLKENKIDYKPGQGTQSKRRLSPDQPVAKNPEFDVTLIPGQWTTRISDPEMDVLTVFDADGTYRAEGMSEGMDTWHYNGRWAVEGNKLLWDVEESDMPFPFDGDMDDVVISISPTELVTLDAEGKQTTYRRVLADSDQRQRDPVKKIVRLASRNGEKSGV